MEIKEIKKRDNRIVKFDQEKIVQAIYKATEAVGQSDYNLAEELTQKVVKILKKKLKPKEIPEVERVQDIVEKVLIEQGRARIAKAYILYRQKRTEIRKEKQQILNKIEIDEVDKKFDLNALRVLSSRYLRKDKDGKVIESPKELFERVAIHVGLASLFYDPIIFQKKGKPNSEEEINLEKYQEKLKIGNYLLNKYHLEALKRVYDRFNRKGEMKMKFSKFLDLLEEKKFDKYEKEIKDYFDLMTERKFMPNSPALANFGEELGMGLACFVLDIEDSLKSIMDTLNRAAIIFKAGGGVGYNFSKLRPEGDFIKTTNGSSSGPISFMTLYDKMTDVIKQGGIRRGASIGILNSDHPDIEKFITAKKRNLQLKNFNISVLIKKNFWNYFKQKKPYPLVNPKNGQIVKYIDPKNLFDLVAYQGWESAEPGVIFDDNINKHNPFLETLGPVQTTNPCGESILYPNESCDLGSINLWNFVEIENKNKERKVEINWEDLKKTIRLAARFLDNVLDVNKYPFQEIEEMSLATRKIGLGIMGLADLLYELEIPYNSKEGLDLVERLMEFVNFHSKQESVQLAKERGRFLYYQKSFYPKGKLPFSGASDKKSQQQDWKGLVKKIKKYGLRNAYTTIIAPTGSIAMIAGCSSGIEPNFSLVYEKKVSVGSFYYINPIFEKKMSREGLFDEALIEDVSRLEGSCQNLTYLPQKFKKIFVCSIDIEPEDHVKALAAVQKWTDSSVSKTINFPEGATLEQIKKTYLFAHDLGCKDLTVFRHKSIRGVYQFGGSKGEASKEKKLISLKDVKAKGPLIYREAGVSEDQGLIGQDFDRELVNNRSELCPKCEIPLIQEEGCKKCSNCGWGKCSI